MKEEHKQDGGKRAKMVQRETALRFGEPQTVVVYKQTTGVLCGGELLGSIYVRPWWSVKWHSLQQKEMGNLGKKLES